MAQKSKARRRLNSGGFATALGEVRDETQASARLSRVAVAPAVTGTIWSAWKVASCPACDSPQYSQRSSACWMTWRRALAGTVMRSSVAAVQPLRPELQ